MRRLIAGLVTLLVWGAADAAPQRIVTMNLCADVLVLQLVAPSRIVSVTHLAHDPRSSTVADLAARVGVNHGLAEEVMASQPDLVIAGKYTTRDAVALMRTLGQPVVDLDVPATFGEVFDQIRLVAGLVGEPARGEAMIAAMNSRLAAIAEVAQGRRPSAIVLQPNGFTVRSGSLVDTLIGKAGLSNLAGDPRLESYRQIPLEELVLARPDFVILDSEPYPGPALAYEVLNHPVLRDLPYRMRAIGVPSRLWTCAGPAIVDAVALMATARDSLR